LKLRTKQNGINSATRLILVAVLVLVCTEFSFGQLNLVPNPSFEYDTICPGNMPSSYTILGAPPWTLFNNGSPDLFDSCVHNTFNNVPQNIFGYHLARTGKAFSGIAVYDPHFFYREYDYVKLLDSLVSGINYCVTFYVSRANNFRNAIDHLDLCLTKTPITTISTPAELAPYIAQIKNTSGNIILDTINWIRISGSFLATGGEKYIAIGNFEQDSSTHIQSVRPLSQDEAYYFVDDVSVVVANASIDAGRDTTICLNNPVILGSPAIDGVEYSWTPSLGLNDPHLAMPVASPTCTTSYILTQTQCNIVKTDTVKVTLKTRGCLVASVPGLLAEPFTVPTIISSGQFFTIQNLPPLTKLDVYDTRGRLVYSKENYDSTMISDELPEGFYFTKLTLNSGFPSVHKLLILH
jgi:hypothetical protein